MTTFTLEQAQIDFKLLNSEAREMLEDVAINELKQYFQARFIDSPFDNLDSVEELFAEIEPIHADNLFMYPLLDGIISTFLKHTPLLDRLKTLGQCLDKLKSSITLQQLIEQEMVPSIVKNGENICKVTFDLEEEWLGKTVEDLERLFKEMEASAVSNFHIASGPIATVFLPSQSKARSLIDFASEEETSHFMSQVGISKLQVGEKVITIEHDDSTFSFQNSLVEAVENENLQVTSFLLELKTFPDAVDDDNWTVLMTASFHGLTAIVDKLLKAGANPNLHSIDGDPPLIIAIDNNRPEIVSLLLTAGANPDLQVKTSGKSPLATAISKRNSKITAMLLKVANPNIQNYIGETALHVASQIGDTVATTMLLNANANPNSIDSDGLTPLIEASEGGHIEVVSGLLEAQANPNLQQKDGVTAIIIASQKGFSQIFNLLLKAGANPNHQTDIGVTALYLASQNGHFEVVKLLVEAGVKVNVQRKNGTTALYQASEGGHLEIVQFLLERNADPNIQGVDGSTALFMASQNGYCSIVRLLLNAKANTDLQTETEHATALHVASQKGYIEIVSLLLKAGANPNIQLKDGRSASFIGNFRRKLRNRYTTFNQQC